MVPTFKSILMPLDQRRTHIGIYVNPFKNPVITYNKLVSCSHNVVNTIKFKRLPAIHVAYIFEKILLPRQEYLSLFTVLNASTINKIMIPWKKLFKTFAEPINL